MVLTSKEPALASCCSSCKTDWPHDALTMRTCDKPVSACPTVSWSLTHGQFLPGPMDPAIRWSLATGSGNLWSDTMKLVVRLTQSLRYQSSVTTFRVRHTCRLTSGLVILLAHRIYRRFIERSATVRDEISAFPALAPEQGRHKCFAFSRW